MQYDAQVSVSDIANLGLHTWHDYVAHAAKRMTTRPLRGADSDSGADGNRQDPNWYGTETYAVAVNMAQQGWQDGAKQIAKTLDSLPPDAEVLPDWSLDVGGSICNVPAFIAGEPECMWRMSECKRSERRISLIVPGTYAGIIRADLAMNYAIGVAALVRSLEASGINAAIYSVVSSKGRENKGNQAAAYGMIVREFGEPLDLAKVAFAFHPSWLRRLGFGWREITQGAVDAGIATGGYGIPAKVTPDLVHYLAGRDIGAIVILPSVNELGLEKSILSDVPSTIEVLRSSAQESIRGLV